MTDPVPYHRRSPLEHERDLPPVTTYAVTDAGLTVYADGIPIAVIPVASFGRLIYELAKHLRG
jgi:hypothetical protein